MPMTDLEKRLYNMEVGEVIKTSYDSSTRLRIIERTVGGWIYVYKFFKLNTKTLETTQVSSSCVFVPKP